MADNETFSAKSCTNCRRLHRKCDRRLPCCSLCHERRKTCVYETVKRGTKTAEHPRPYPSLTTTASIVTTKVETPTNSDSFDFVSMYTDLAYFMTFYMPVISHGKLMDILQFLDEERAGIPQMISPPDWEDIALIYAMQASNYKSRGNNELAQQLFEASRSIIMNYFERVSVNFIVAACFLFLGLYCTYDDDLHRATFFFRNVKGYMEYESARGKQRHACFPFLEHLYIMSQCLMTEDCDLDLIIKSFMTTLYCSRELAKSDTKSVLNNNNNNIVQVLANIDFNGIDIEKIRLDVAERTIYHYTLDEEKISRLSLKISSIFEQLSTVIPEPLLACRKLSIMFFLEGVRLQRYIRLGNNDSARAIADYIARMTTNPAFLLCFPLVGVVVSIAASFHLSCMKTTVDFMDKGNLLDRLREELVAITTISDKIKCLRSRFANLIVSMTSDVSGVEGNVFMHSFTPIVTQESPKVPVRTSYNFSNTMQNFAAVFQDKSTVNSVVRGASNVASSAGSLLSEELNTSLMFVDDVLSLDAVDDLFQDFVDF